MAVKLGFEAITYVLKKVLTKKGVRGIATIPGKAYDMRMKQLVDEMAFKMKELGYDINTVTQKEVQGLLDSAEAIAKQKPTPESLIKGKKYTDDRGRTWDFSTKDRPYPGWKPEIVKTKVDLFATEKEFVSDLRSSQLNFIKNDPRFNLELAVKLRNPGVKTYGWTPSGDKSKLLSPSQRQKTLDKLKEVMKHDTYQTQHAEELGFVDLTDDIFTIEKAEGGRIGYAVGKLVKGGKWFLNNLRKALNDIEADKGFKNLTPDRKEGLTSEIKNLIKSIEGGGPIPDEMIQTIRQDPKFANVSKTRSTDPDLYEFEDLILNYGKKGDVVDEQVKILEEFTPTGKGNADGGRIGMMYGGDPGFAFEYGGSWADWHDQHRNTMPVEQYIQTKLPKARLPFREMQSGGLAYMLGEPTYMKYYAGGSVGHAPWHKPTGQPQPQPQSPQPGGAPGGGRPDPMKAPRGLPSLAPRTMDPAFMQQQAMQKAMMGQQRMGQGQPRMGMDEGGTTPKIPEQFLENLKRREYHEFLEKYRRWKENYERRKDLAPTQEAAGGGRIGFGLGGIDKGRRAFMKWLAGITGAGVAAGTGLLKFGKAAKVVPKVTETIARGADGMPVYITDLIEVVKAKGTKDIIEGFKRTDYSTVHSYKGVDVVEDAAGNTRIKQGKETPLYGSDEPAYHETHMEITKGEYVKDKKGKMVKAGDEYFEGTVRPDRDGKMKDIIEEIDEADHLDLKKIADEVDTLEIPGYDRFSKASGGLAHMLGE